MHRSRAERMRYNWRRTASAVRVTMAPMLSEESSCRYRIRIRSRSAAGSFCVQNSNAAKRLSIASHWTIASHDSWVNKSLLFNACRQRACRLRKARTSKKATWQAHAAKEDPAWNSSRFRNNTVLVSWSTSSASAKLGTKVSTYANSRLWTASTSTVNGSSVSKIAASAPKVGRKGFFLACYSLTARETVL